MEIFGAIVWSARPPRATSRRPDDAGAAMADPWRMEEVLAYAVVGLVGLWGVSHVIPTRAVVAGSGKTSAVDRRMPVQEWLAEAVTTWSLTDEVGG
ncbi:hypothetical protein AMK33_38500 [Streptomyces sp. CB02400]|nr:hypothetical protein AMK33_38500 [Streptomyces sp. CB02400]